MSERETARGTGRRVEIALLATAVLVVAIVIAIKVVSGGDGSDRARNDGGAVGTSTDTAVPTEPESAPGRGSYIESSVAADGTVSVRQWIRSSTPIRALQVSTFTPTSAQGGSAEASDVVVQALDGSVIAKQDTVGADTVRLQLSTAVPNLFLSYRITGGLANASQTVPGRMLANVLGMDVDYSGATGSVQRRVTGPGAVTNLACLRVSDSAGTPPKPCGAPTQDNGWLVSLRGIDRTDRLLAQLDASATPSASSS